MLTIDFIGYDGTHPANFIYGLPKGHEAYLLLLTATPAEFYLPLETTAVSEAVPSIPSLPPFPGDARRFPGPHALGENRRFAPEPPPAGEFRRFPAGTAILYTPGSFVLYKACEETYVNDWIRFRCDEAFADQLPLKNQPFQVGDAQYCHDLFKLMTWESTMSDSDGSEVISHLLKALLLKLAESCSRPITNPHAQEMLDLRKRIYNNPELSWSVDAMAQELHLSSGYLQSIYKSTFGSSCMEDVILQRLKRAQDQLISTAKSVQEIAEDCGYNNVEHFCRQFRKFLGISPGRYRKEHAEKIPTAPKHLTVGGSDVNAYVPRGRVY